MNHRFSWTARPLALLLLALLPCAAVVRADEPPPTPAPASGAQTPSALPAPTGLPPTPTGLPPTLAQALAEAEPSQADGILTVGAEQVALPKDTAPPPKGLEAGAVAAGYGRITQEFGDVMAIAPPTMTLLNTDPGTPNPYSGMPPADALKMLLGTLTDAQWKALTGPGGLGLSTLSSETQRSLFQALFPGESLTLHPRHDTGDNSPDDWAHLPKLTQADLAQATLRLGQRVMVGIPVVGKDEWLNSPPEPAGGKPAYEVYGGQEHPKDTLYGVTVRQEVPNTLKPSDLDWDEKRWAQPVSLEGIKTLGDLIARIGQSARTELYADRRYEKRSVLWIAPKGRPAATARAKDLLRALALCVAGAYRRVGPAYVLTNDVVGIGPRRTILSRFSQEADLARHAALSEAADTFIQAHGGVDDLPPLDGQRAFSDAQKKKAAQDNPQGYTAMGQGTQFQATLDQLTPEQQDTARRFVKNWEAQHAAGTNNGGEPPDQVTLSGKLFLMAQPMFLLQSPTVPGTISLESYFSSWDLFRPSDKLAQKMREKQQQSPPAPTSPPAPKPAAPPALASLLAPIPRRAVIARPRTAQDVDTLVAAMKTVGLNQLWLDVFSEGKPHLDQGKDNGPDILTQALARTKGTGIAVIPTMDLLQWGLDAPAEARDLTIQGETSAQAAGRRQRYEAVLYQGQTPEEAAKQPAPTVLSVSPVSPLVRQTLIALVRRLAATPGVAALALRQTVMPGYNRPADSHFGVQGDPLGYTLSLRLALLRKSHVDPIDLEPETYEGQMNADLSLPEFEDWQALGTVSQDWNGMRSDADRDLLQTLLQAAQQSAGRRFPFLIKQRRESWRGNWYGLWDDPRARLPELTEELSFGASSSTTNLAAFARAQSRTNLSLLDPWVAQSQDSLATALQELKPGWDGIVLDFTGGSDSGNPLAPLVKSLAPPAPQRTGKTLPPP